MFRGKYYPEEDVIGWRYPGRGGAYDFHRVDAGKATGFLARSPASDIKLSSPPSLDDGWKTAEPKDVGIDVTPIEQMIRDYVLKPPSSTHDLSIHSVLIARNGKLAVEEYFHGYHRDLPHDSRSASKSVTSILAAAAMHDGIDLSWDTPAYALFDTAELLQQEPERGDITLRHLVNMNSGLDCDDRNPESAANEDYLWDHADELDFYEHTINVAVIRPPGQVAAYCSASANLAGGVIAAAAGKSLLSVIDRLVARPLEIKRYAVPHSPDGHPFMGGGIRWLARDFLKFPQLLLNDGVWNDQRILSGPDVQLMLTPAVKIDGGRDYAYLWWIADYPYRGRTIRAHFMGGNGGQIAMLVPELELSVVFNAGNYSDRVMFQIQEELIPNYILPAIRE
jgi:CubicO group peptidase (beta-lactamase class C family)